MMQKVFVYNFTYIYNCIKFCNFSEQPGSSRERDECQCLPDHSVEKWFNIISQFQSTVTMNTQDLHMTECCNASDACEREKLIESFKEITCVDTKRAEFYLEKSGWQVDVSLECFIFFLIRKDKKKLLTPVLSATLKFHACWGCVRLQRIIDLLLYRS